MKQAILQKGRIYRSLKKMQRNQFLAKPFHRHQAMALDLDLIQMPLELFLPWDLMAISIRCR
jgi:hypothetical protein